MDRLHTPVVTGDDVSRALDEAISLIGLMGLASGLGISYQAIRKWQKHGRMPRTEWTGETQYAQAIERLTEGAVSKQRLLAVRCHGPCREEAA